jgi:glycosyltransferase involved in cell wall biosynthesis
MPLSASIVITTRDRCEDLLKALQSACSQTVTCEIIVVDDASTDGTPTRVAEAFPNVRLLIHESPTGLIVGRNSAARIATGDVIFSLDDDAVFSSPYIVEKVLSIFQTQTSISIGAVAIPHIDIHKSPNPTLQVPDSKHLWLTDSFTGTAYAVLRKRFLELGGFDEFFFHQNEERDFAIRMMQSGHFIAVADCPPIHHFESPKRSLDRMDIYGRRNDILFAWKNVPYPYLPFRLAGTITKGLLFGVRVGRPLNMLKGVLFGLKTILSGRVLHCPVSHTTYHIAGCLRKEKYISSENLEKILHRKSKTL